MLIKLSGDRYVNSECIESIDRTQYSASPNGNVQWTVRLTSGNYIGLTQVQFEELLSAIPAPYDAEFRRKWRVARQTVMASMEWNEWHKLSDDEQGELIGAEVDRADTH